MSDKYCLLSYYVILCQTCLSRMSIVVILCQTCLSRAVAQDITISIPWSWEELVYNDFESEQASNTVEVLSLMSDKPWQPELLPIVDSDSNIAQDQSDTNIFPGVESWSTTDVVSNSSGSIVWSWPLDSTWGLLIPDSSQPTVWQWAVEQNPPEIAYSSVENEPQEDISSLMLMMTSFVLPNPSPQLSITEVRIDGTDEYIELTNRWDPFIGSVSISWVKTSWLLTTTLNLWTNESVVIGDTLAMVVSSWFDIVSGQWLSMTDTTARSLQLIYSGDVIDSLDLIVSQVLWSDNQSAAREYDFSQQLWQVTPISHNTNIISWHRGNPWLVRWLTLFPANTWTISTWLLITWSISTGTIFTGVVTTWTVVTWMIITGAASTGIVVTWIVMTWIILTWTQLTWSIQISQIYPFADCVGEHLSLSFTAPYSWSLTIAGLGTSDTSKIFDISAQSGSVRYLVESMSGVLSDNVILVPNMTLTDDGESLIMSNWSGLVLDSVIYSSTQANKASIFTSYSWGTRIFTTNQATTLLTSCHQSIQVPQIGWCRISAVNEWYITGSFSAWFTVSGSLVDSTCSSSSRLVDWAISTNNSCSLWQSFAPWSHRVTYQQYSGATMVCEDEYMFYGAIHQQTITNTLTTTIIQTGEQHVCGIVAQHTTPLRFGNSINLIASLDRDEIQNSSSYQCQRSWLTFTGSDSCNPWYFTLPQAILAPLQLTISKDGQQLCQTHSFISYPSISSSSSSSTSPSSTSTYYEDLYRKRKDKHDVLATNIRKQWCTVNAQDQLGWECSFDTSIQQQSSSGTASSSNTDASLSLYRFQQHQAVMIDRIIADPPWRDTDGWELVSLIWDDEQAQSWSVLLLVINNKANRVITWSWWSDLAQLIYDSFPLPNDGWCVALTDWETIYDQVCYGSYHSSDMLDLTTIEISNKMRELYADEGQIVTISDSDDALELLNLDLREQKLINKVLKQEQYQEISDIWDRYRSKTNELYQTYRSITNSKQDYIDLLHTKLEQSRAYATRITQLYQSSKEYIQTLSDRNAQYYQEKLYIQQHYPAIYLDPILSQTTWIDIGSWLLISQLSHDASQSQSRRSTLRETLQNLL